MEFTAFKYNFPAIKKLSVIEWYLDAVSVFSKELSSEYIGTDWLNLVY